MATTTTKPTNELVPLAEMPRTKAAMAKRQPILEEKLKTEALLSQYRSALTPAIAIEQNPSPDVIWAARGNLPSVEMQYAKLLEQLAEADRVVEAAKELDREELRRRFAERKREVTAELWAKLEEARPANAQLSKLEELEHQLCGTYLDPLAWPQLLPSTRERTSFFDEWVKRISGKPMPGVWSESAVLNEDSI